MTGEPAPEGAGDEPEQDEAERKRGFFSRLRENMSKTRQALGAELQATMFETVDDEAFERLEEALIMADVGAPTTAKIVEPPGGRGRRRPRPARSSSSRLQELIAETATVDGDTIDLTHRPTVILMVGVNGTGKTTTIGKIASHLTGELGRTVLLAAGDTFRAAAAEQLEVWAERSGADLVRGAEGSDPAAVVFDALEAAVGPRPRRGDHRHRRAAAHPAAPDGRAGEGAQGDRLQAAGRAARDAAHDRRHHRPERAAPGAAVPRGGRRHRHRPHQARRHGEGRHRAGDRPGARACR